MNKNYVNQDRGSSKEYLQYLEAMDAIAIEKVASASVYFEPNPNNVLVDVGMASGTSSAILAKLFPALDIIGVDINPKMVEIASNMYQGDNLSFRADDGERLNSFELNSIHGFFNCSTIHHITSYNGYDSNRAIHALRRQVDLLKDNGVIVVRDFVKPEEREVIIELSTLEKSNRPSDAELFIRFAKTARSLAKVEERGFPIEEIDSPITNRRRFKAFLTDVTEFIRRKDYYDHWDVELQEEYGYFTQKEFENIFRELGLRIIISSPIHNQWIINNRYRDQFRLLDQEGMEIPFPPTNYIIVGEKTGKGKHVQLVRHLPFQKESFLSFSSYQNIENGTIWDVVKRPNVVYDILPYSNDGNGIKVLAKKGYPRPLATVSAQSPIIDGKQYAGYIPEGITIDSRDNIEDVLSKDFGIHRESYEVVHDSLSYYTSPGGIDERILSKSIRLNRKPSIGHSLQFNRRGFKDFGYVYEYDAIQLLNTAQTGALLEARLELNIYNLLFEEKQALPKWLGESLIIDHVSNLNFTCLDDLFRLKAEVYESSTSSSNFMKVCRALFAEIGGGQSQSILEYVFPSDLSSNTLVTLPVCRFENDIYIGLEVRKLPVPQLHSGNSILLTVPAQRLPNSVVDYTSLESYLKDLTIGNSVVLKYAKLGEKYFPSIGITPEQVYPCVVCLDKPSEVLSWVRLSDVFENRLRLEDAHLIIAISRFIHLIQYNFKD